VNDADRICVQPCGCRYDLVTGLATAFCAGHDVRRLLEEARRVVQAPLRTEVDAAYVDALLGRALEALGR
jgi:enoyl-CoA hydratase/carnithine racemase